ncbi:FeS-binding protein [Desulfovibrio sp. ZJ200]|uniref:FeS-binding protein n=1 Tax=Desulfovibrio sp. ZJ200 TaxID=2709792 RepID=UPI0013EE1A04|nr:FeS-binding protein [Desulfovibrio sp. ZJ200]
MTQRPRLFSSFFNLLWFAAVLAAVLSGLAHLPVAHRCGIMPVWRSSPTVAHYWSAAALLLLGAYAAVVWWRLGRREYALTRFGLVRAILLGFLGISGIVLILHNLPGFSVYDSTYALIKLGHLFCVLALFPLVCMRLLLRGQWLRLRSAAEPRRKRRARP